MEELLKQLSDKTNRKIEQTRFMFNMLGCDFQKLVLVEEKLRNNYVFACPSTPDEFKKVLSMGDGDKWYTLSEFKKK